MWLSFRSPHTSYIFWLVSLITMVNYGAAMVTALYAGMPPYYLTNLLFLIFVLVITASGLHFRHALLLNTVCLIVFVIFSQTIKRDPFYFSQYPHLITLFLYIHIVGFVLERSKRLNFLQFNDLINQKRLVEDLNQQKNKIISILSHDVAAPLNSLSTLLYLHSKDNIGEQDLKLYLPKLSDQFNHVSVLLFSLVRWSRSQMEGFVLDKSIISVTDLMEREIKFFDIQLLDKGLEVRVVAPVRHYVNVDEEMMRIGIRNLLSNAIKFSRNGTVIQLKVTKSKSDKVTICVTNSGQPVAPELVDKLFTFQMSSTADSRGEKGTGLGLAMTAFFVRLNGGEISLIPTDDGTTTFCIELPEAVNQMAN